MGGGRCCNCHRWCRDRSASQRRADPLARHLAGNEMSATGNDPKPRGSRWWEWDTWKSLSTFSVTVGWILGVPAGALLAIAWGVWASQASEQARQHAYTDVIAQYQALATLVNAQQKVIESAAVERASLRERLTKLEQLVPPVSVTAELIERLSSHINAQDGRSDTIERSQAALRDSLQAQITSLCSNLVSIRAASAKSPKPCP